MRTLMIFWAQVGVRLCGAEAHVPGVDGRIDDGLRLQVTELAARRVDGIAERTWDYRQCRLVLMLLRVVFDNDWRLDCCSLFRGSAHPQPQQPTVAVWVRSCRRR